MPDENINENEELQENEEELQADENEKEEVKYFSKANVDYLLTQLAERIRESHIGE